MFWGRKTTRVACTRQMFWGRKTTRVACTKRYIVLNCTGMVPYKVLYGTVGRIASWKSDLLVPHDIMHMGYVAGEDVCAI